MKSIKKVKLAKKIEYLKKVMNSAYAAVSKEVRKYDFDSIEDLLAVRSQFITKK